MRIRNLFHRNKTNINDYQHSFFIVLDYFGYSEYDKTLVDERIANHYFSDTSDDKTKTPYPPTQISRRLGVVFKPEKRTNSVLGFYKELAYLLIPHFSQNNKKSQGKDEYLFSALKNCSGTAEAHYLFIECFDYLDSNIENVRLTLSVDNDESEALMYKWCEFLMSCKFKSKLSSIVLSSAYPDRPLSPPGWIHALTIAMEQQYEDSYQHVGVLPINSWSSAYESKTPKEIFETKIMSVKQKTNTSSEQHKIKVSAYLSGVIEALKPNPAYLWGFLSLVNGADENTIQSDIHLRAKYLKYLTKLLLPNLSSFLEHPSHNKQIYNQLADTTSAQHVITEDKSAFYRKNFLDSYAKILHEFGESQVSYKLQNDYMIFQILAFHVFGFQHAPSYTVGNIPEISAIKSSFLEIQNKLLPDLIDLSNNSSKPTATTVLAITDIIDDYRKNQYKIQLDQLFENYVVNLGTVNLEENTLTTRTPSVCFFMMSYYYYHQSRVAAEFNHLIIHSLSIFYAEFADAHKTKIAQSEKFVGSIKSLISNWDTAKQTTIKTKYTSVITEPEIVLTDDFPNEHPIEHQPYNHSTTPRNLVEELNKHRSQIAILALKLGELKKLIKIEKTNSELMSSSQSAFSVLTVPLDEDHESNLRSHFSFTNNAPEVGTTEEQFNAGNDCTLIFSDDNANLNFQSIVNLIDTEKNRLSEPALENIDSISGDLKEISVFDTIGSSLDSGSSVAETDFAKKLYSSCVEFFKPTTDQETFSEKGRQADYPYLYVNTSTVEKYIALLNSYISIHEHYSALAFMKPLYPVITNEQTNDGSKADLDIYLESTLEFCKSSVEFMEHCALRGYADSLEQYASKLVHYMFENSDPPKAETNETDTSAVDNYFLGIFNLDLLIPKNIIKDQFSDLKIIYASDWEMRNSNSSQPVDSKYFNKKTLTHILNHIPVSSESPNASDSNDQENGYPELFKNAKEFERLKFLMMGYLVDTTANVKYTKQLFSVNELEIAKGEDEDWTAAFANNLVSFEPRIENSFLTSQVVLNFTPSITKEEENKPNSTQVNIDAFDILYDRYNPLEGLTLTKGELESEKSVCINLLTRNESYRSVFICYATRDAHNIRDRIEMEINEFNRNEVIELSKTNINYEKTEKDSQELQADESKLDRSSEKSVAKRLVLLSDQNLTASANWTVALTSAMLLADVFIVVATNESLTQHLYNRTYIKSFEAKKISQRITQGYDESNPNKRKPKIYFVYDGELTSNTQLINKVYGPALSNEASVKQYTDLTNRAVGETSDHEINTVFSHKEYLSMFS